MHAYSIMTPQQAQEKFRQYLAGTHSPATVRRYSTTIEEMFRVVGDKPVESLSFEDVMKYKSYLYGKGNLSASVAVKLSAVQKFVEFLKKLYHITTVSSEDLRLLRPRVSQKIPSYLEKEKIQRLISACKDIEEEVVVKLLFFTGMRASELISLTEKDILQIDDTLYLRIKGKGGYERRIPLVSEVAECLNRYLTYHRLKYNTERLFPYGYHTLYYRVKKIASRVGLDEVTPHWLRHSCATEMLSQGVDIRVIAEVCGHKSLNTTMRYAKVKPVLAREALEKLKIDGN
ncbi:tyrosine-type recombinase/integrase [Thermodesulfovibrio yellowstonii]|uniref:tyrosine-type recombinase/integrase n=1 Tax=Thermodesulfovibrio yellowstonii TaxID=28262 RepID=UPI00040C6761|nr:tyrosine-type recombinase/integrase [Thermodesulfovibrio islandicus]